MEPSPLYQGHQFKPAQAPQARLSPEIPFGQQYVNNLGETTKSLRRIEDARGQIAELNMGATAIGTAINVPASYL